jgi:predicted transcriptional regulator
VPALAAAVTDSRTQVRWEATRALCEIGDPSAAPALIDKLEGRDSGVRWMAADGLVALGPVVLQPLMHALVRRSDSVLFRESAHRVLQGLAGRPGYESILRPVMVALESASPDVGVPLAAYNALDELRRLPPDAASVVVIRKVRVRDWMTSTPLTVAPSVTVADAYQRMKERRIRRLPVVTDDGIVGIVSLGDLREALATKPAGAVGEIMSKPVVTIEPEASLRRAARQMIDHRIGGLPVVASGSLVGIITETDIFRVFAQQPSLGGWDE